MKRRAFSYEIYTCGDTKNKVIMLHLGTKSMARARRIGGWTSWHLTRMFEKRKKAKK